MCRNRKVLKQNTEAEDKYMIHQHEQQSLGYSYRLLTQKKRWRRFPWWVDAAERDGDIGSLRRPWMAKQDVCCCCKAEKLHFILLINANEEDKKHQDGKLIWKDVGRARAPTSDKR